MKIKLKVYMGLISFSPLILRILYLFVESIILARFFSLEPDSLNEIASKIFMPVAYIGSLTLLLYSFFRIDGLKHYTYLITAGLIQILLSVLCSMLYIWQGIAP